MLEIRVPTLGESVTEATVATWFKQVGDAVKVDEMLCELETDKVTVEVPAPAAGVLAEIVAKEGETVGVDALLATIDEKSAAQPAPAKAAAAKPAAAEPAKAAPKPAPADEIPGKASPTDAESAPANEQSIDVVVPSLGESVTEATVSTWFKKVGDAVTQDEMLCELETDKVSVEVPSPASGTLAEIFAKDHATVAAGGKLGRIAGGGAATGATAAPVAAAAAAAVAREPSPRRDVEDAPSAKKAMADRGIDPASGDRHRPRRPHHEGGRAPLGSAEPGAGPAALARPGPGGRVDPALAGARRGRRARGAGQDDPPAPDHRPPAQGGAEHRRHAHHLQRGGHDRGHGACATNTRSSSRRSTA